MKIAKRILVTGASGFIGRATVSALLEAGYFVIEASRSRGISSASQSEAMLLDLADPCAFLAAAETFSFDAIVHLGARVGLTTETESDMYVENILATGCLAHLAKQCNAQLIFASTAIVHGARAQKIQVDSLLCPDTPYARTKLLGERLIEASGVKHCVLRIAGVFGSNGPSHLALNRSIADARKGLSPVQNGTGSALRNYVYVEDVARAIVYALLENLTGTHLLAGHSIMTIAEMMQVVCETFCPDQHPLIKNGASAADQLITPSVFLPQTRTFREAMAAIQAQGDN